MPLVYALSVNNEIEKIGSYAGFAAVLGLAVLALLYFSQAREVKRLREWAGRSPERAQELEQRVIEQAEIARQVASERRVVAQPQPRPAPASPATPGTAAGAATAGAAAAAVSAAPAAPARPPLPTGVPLPAMAATAVAPSPPAKPEEAPATTVAPATTAAPATPAASPAVTPAAPAPATVAGGAVIPAAAPEREVASGNGSPDAPPTFVAPPPPPVRTPAPPVPPARSAALRSDSPSATIPPRRPAEPPRRGRDDGHRRGWGTVGVVVATLAIIGGAAAILVTTLGGDDTPKEPNVPGQVDTGTGSTQSTSTKRTTPVARGKVVVAVLNGTTFTGLAADVANKVEAAGFKKGAVTNAGDQTRSATLIQYAAGFQKQAHDIGRVLKVDAIEKLDASTKAVACPPGECPTAQKPEPDVVVTVGADRTN